MSVGTVISAIAGSSESSGKGEKSGIDGILSGGPAASLITSIINDKGTKKSKEELLAALDEAKGYITSGYDEATGIYRPIYEQGMQDYQRLGDMVRGGEFDVNAGRYSYDDYREIAPYKQQDFKFEADPGYQFRQQEGSKAIEGSAAARGSQLSGATLKALQKYGQGLASDEYNRAYGRYQDQRNFGYNRFLNDRNYSRGNYETDRQFGYGVFNDEYNRNRMNATDKYNRYNALSNIGLNAASNMANLSTSRAGDYSNLAIQRGNVTAGGTQAHYQNLGDVATGGTSLGFGAANDIYSAINQGSGQGGGSYNNWQQNGGQGNYQPTTAYPGGVPNANYDYYTGVDYTPNTTNTTNTWYAPVNSKKEDEFDYYSDSRYG